MLGTAGVAVTGLENSLEPPNKESVWFQQKTIICCFSVTWGVEGIPFASRSCWLWAPPLFSPNLLPAPMPLLLLPTSFPTGCLLALAHLLLFSFTQFALYVSVSVLVFAFCSHLPQSSPPMPWDLFLFLQASVLFPHNPSSFHPSVLAHVSHTFTLHLAHHQLLPFLLACSATFIIFTTISNKPLGDRRTWSHTAALNWLPLNKFDLLHVT